MLTLNNHQLKLVVSNNGKQWDGLLLTPPIGVNAPKWQVRSRHSGNEEQPEMNIKRAGVDIAKSVFHIHGVDRHDCVQWQTALKRCQ